MGWGISVFPNDCVVNSFYLRHIEHDGHNLCSTCNLVPVVASAEEMERME